MRRVLSVAFAALLLMLVPISGCLQDDVGVYCSGVEVDKDKPDTVFMLHALDCESRICVSYQSGSAGARCTVPCEDDSDCPSDGVAGCSKFVCRIGVSTGTTINCCKFCVCDDDADAVDSQIENCKNQTAHCPNI